MVLEPGLFPRKLSVGNFEPVALKSYFEGSLLEAYFRGN